MGRKIDPLGYHVVDHGDWLSKLAGWDGLPSRREISNHGNNAQLRRRRRTPSINYAANSRAWTARTSVTFRPTTNAVVVLCPPCVLFVARERIDLDHVFSCACFSLARVVSSGCPVGTSGTRP
jgi:hypothetical protein